MTMPEAVRAVLGNYANFEGRARRSEYWWWTLALILAYVAILVVSGILTAISDALGILGILLYVALVLGAIVPSIAVTVRRLHDTDRSGWWYLISFVPLVGAIVLIVFTVTDSNPGPNRFGPNPKQELSPQV